MSILNNITGLLKKDEEGNLFDVLIGDLKDELYTEALAIAHAIDLIARMACKTELKVYKYNNKERKIESKIEEIYYRLNIKPNPNQTGTAFMYKLVTTLLKEQKALVILNNTNQKIPYMYIAKDYNADKYILKDKTFNNIYLEDAEGNDLPLEKTYGTENSIYLSLENSSIADTLKKFNEKYKELLKVAFKQYKNTNTNKWKLRIPRNATIYIRPYY